MSRLLRIFGLARPDRVAGPDTAEDWNPGDLAECVYHGPWYRFRDGRTGVGPSFRDRDIVRSAFVGDSGLLVLRFSRFGDRTYDARAFRKINPQPDELVAADPAFLATHLRPRELVQ